MILSTVTQGKLCNSIISTRSELKTIFYTLPRLQTTSFEPHCQPTTLCIFTLSELPADDRIDDVLVGKAGGEEGHQVVLRYAPPQRGPAHGPQPVQVQQDHTGVEATTQRGPRPVVLPQLAYEQVLKI